MMTKTFELWMEGYACNGNQAPAEFLGVFEANTFKEACDKWAETLKEDKKYYHSSTDGKNSSYWGCHIFDNEHEARRCFG